MSKKNDPIQSILDCIQMPTSEARGATLQELLDAAAEQGKSQGQVKALLKRLKQEGKLRNGKRQSTKINGDRYNIPVYWVER